MQEIKERISEILDSEVYTREEQKRLIAELINEPQEEKKDFYLPGYWKPEKDQDYWYSDTYSMADKDTWSNHAIDDYRLSLGVIFKTKAEAEYHCEWLEAYKKYVTTIARLNAELGWAVNWESNNQEKFTHIFNWSTKELKCNIFWRTDQFKFDREYFSIKIRNQLEQELGEDLIIFAITGKKRV